MLYIKERRYPLDNAMAHALEGFIFIFLGTLLGTVIYLAAWIFNLGMEWWFPGFAETQLAWFLALYALLRGTWILAKELSRPALDPAYFIGSCTAVLGVALCLRVTPSMGAATLVAAGLGGLFGTCHRYYEERRSARNRPAFP